MENSRSKFNDHLKEMDNEFIRLVNEGKFIYNTDNAVIFNTHTGREVAHGIRMVVSGNNCQMNSTRARQLLTGNLLPGEIKHRSRNI